ncbi:nitroreductase [Lucifera butyrica]|uniref:Nitroreductase n=1 Tax=Lucifera butyrica TaxID=1351585 RepID=A0A498R835_9FIRM|nr:nitroreductase family protein [Lucifera butyrica]VBB08876.1 nitroreductase [Lucifera butyrica]
MELKDVIIKRRTIRDFSDKPINQEIIKKALRDGLKAPSYNHLKQWDFILVKDHNIRMDLTQTEKMTEEITDGLRLAFANHEALAQEMYLDAIPKQKRMILTAPELLVIIYKPKTQIIESKRVYDLNCLASVWCCIENILLSLAEEDIFGVTFIPQNTSAIKEVFNIPQELEIAAIIPFGYKAPDAKIIPQQEIALESRLHINNW